MSDTSLSAREGALAKLAAEAARFAAGGLRPAQALELAPPRAQPAAHDASATSRPQAPPGYVPVAVAPERGNTRPVVPVDGRIHMRMAQATIDALDEAVAAWKADDPRTLRDLERATVIRVAVALALTDISLRGGRGAVGEAVRAALDPAVRHTDGPMPPLERWLMTPTARDAADPTVDPTAAVASGSR